MDKAFGVTPAQKGILQSVRYPIKDAPVAGCSLDECVSKAIDELNVGDGDHRDFVIAMETDSQWTSIEDEPFKAIGSPIRDIQLDPYEQELVVNAFEGRIGSWRFKNEVFGVKTFEISGEVSDCLFGATLLNIASGVIPDEVLSVLQAIAKGTHVSEGFRYYVTGVCRMDSHHHGICYFYQIIIDIKSGKVYQNGSKAVSLHLEERERSEPVVHDYHLVTPDNVANADKSALAMAALFSDDHTSLEAVNEWKRREGGNHPSGRDERGDDPR